MGLGLPISLLSCSLARRLCLVREGVKERGRRAHCFVYLLNQSLSRDMAGRSSFGPGLVAGRRVRSDLFLVKCPTSHAGEAMWVHLLFDPLHVPKLGSYG